MLDAEAIKNRVLSESAEHFELYRNIFEPEDTVLDVGMGPGYTARLILEETPSVELQGLDVIDIRKIRDVPLTLYSGTKFPFVDDEFDTSLLFYVLHHIKWPALTLREAARVSKKNMVIIEEFRKSGADEKKDEEAERGVHLSLGIPCNLHSSYLEESELEALIHDNNLKIIMKKRLESATTRKVDKYLYVLEV